MSSSQKSSLSLKITAKSLITFGLFRFAKVCPIQQQSFNKTRPVLQTKPLSAMFKNETFLMIFKQCDASED